MTSTLHKTAVHVQQCLAELFLEPEILRTKVVQKIKTHVFHYDFFFFKNRAVYRTMCKNTAEPDKPQIAV